MFESFVCLYHSLTFVIKLETDDIMICIFILALFSRKALPFKCAIGRHPFVFANSVVVVLSPIRREP